MTLKLRQVWESMVRDSRSKPVPSGDAGATQEEADKPSQVEANGGSEGPDVMNFQRFLLELRESFPEKDYRWTKGKERSCKWMLSRVPANARGVDVGGTEYLCRKLAEKGCQVTFFDLEAPSSFENRVQDDMFNILRHFPERSLDFITTRHTLEHSLVPMYQLWAYNRLLKDDGKLLVIVPMHNKRWVWFTTHFSCLPYENWLMLFYRTGFKVDECDAGNWSSKSSRPDFVEYRFALSVESRTLRLAGND